MADHYVMVVLYQALNPISGQTDFRVKACQKEKRTLSGAPAGVSGFGCVAALAAHE